MNEDEKRLRGAVRWDEGPAPRARQCVRCGVDDAHDDDADDDLCHPCAHLLVGEMTMGAICVLTELDKLRAVAKAAEAHIAALDAPLATDDDGVAWWGRLGETMDAMREASKALRAGEVGK